MYGQDGFIAEKWQPRGKLTVWLGRAMIYRKSVNIDANLLETGNIDRMGKYLHSRIFDFFDGV